MTALEALEDSAQFALPILMLGLIGCGILITPTREANNAMFAVWFTLCAEHLMNTIVRYR